MKRHDIAEVRELAGAEYMPLPARDVLSDHQKGGLARNHALTMLNQLAHEVRTNQAALRVPRLDAWPTSTAPLAERFAAYATAVERVASVTEQSTHRDATRW